MYETPLPRQEFAPLENNVWLFTGAESPPARGVIEAVNTYLNNRGDGPAGREENARVEENCKANLASLLQGKAEDIALVSNSSEAISAIALALNLQQGDNVVVTDLEFPSGILPWLALQEIGVEVRVTSHRDFHIEPVDIMRRVDERTRLVLCSHVSYLSGARLDYQSLYALLQETDALFALDATQSLGVVPVDMRHADFVVCSSYKWLLGLHGAGVLALNAARVEKLSPRLVGWRSVSDMFSETRFEKFTHHIDARRFELGYPSYPTIYALEYSTRLLLKCGIANIERHVLQLGGELLAALEDRGMEPLTPREDARRAGNIAWRAPRGEEIADALRAQNILLWGGDDRVRASIHGYTAREEIERLLRALDSSELLA